MLIKIIKQLYYHFKKESIIKIKNRVDNKILKLNMYKRDLNKEIDKIDRKIIYGTGHSTRV